MKKSLILYCINLLRHCPDPWGTGGAPCRMGFPIDGGRQAGMCGIPVQHGELPGCFRPLPRRDVPAVLRNMAEVSNSALSRAGMFRWPWPYRGWLPRFLPQRDVPRPLLSRRHGWGIPTQNRRARFRWEFHISSGEVQQLIHRGSLLV